MSVRVNRRIDFNDPMVGKPANLQNSAVLRMLEEEEIRKSGGQATGVKRVAWPPLSDEDFIEVPPVQSQGGQPQAQPYRSVQLKPAKPVEPPPSTITLRPQAPVSQAPPPLVTSQPATATLRGGKNLRGDLKWPPEEVKEKMEAERNHLIELQKGPQFRPPKLLKDYSRFFEQHALNSTYPGYKIPPGTQFYEHNPVW